MNKKINYLFVICMALLMFTACGKPTNEEVTNTNPEGVVQENKAGVREDKDLKVGVPFFDSALDPAAGYAGWHVMRFSVGETLVFITDEMKASAWLCSEFNQLDENTWEFVIRDDVSFHNGKPMTAVEVKESLERSIALNERAQSSLEGVSFEIDGNKLIAKTAVIDPILPEKLSDPMFIVVDAEAATADEEGFKQNPICTGAYQVASFVPDERVSLLPFDAYWGGIPKLGTVEYIKIADANTRMMALQSGEINIAVGLGDSQVAVIGKDDSFAVDTVSSMRVIYAMFNPQNEFLKDKRVREALNFAMDKETLTKQVLNNTMTAADGPYPPSLPFGKDDLNIFSFDADRASNLLKEAGFEDKNSNGFLEKDGKELALRMLYYSSRAEIPIIAQYMQAEYKKMGVNIELVPYEKLPTEQYAAGDFDIGFDSFTVALSSNPKTLLDIGFVRGASDNFNNYFNNPVIDEIAAQLAVESDLAKRIELGKQAERIIVEETMNIFIGYPQNIISRSKDVSGFYVHPLDFYQLNHNTDITK